MILTCVICLSTASLSHASDKFYISSEELDATHETFRIHIGHNMWIKTNTVHRDVTGLYTCEQDIVRQGGVKAEYQRVWRCPYVIIIGL
jgi:hypothetical protein